MRNFIVCTVRLIESGRLNLEEKLRWVSHVATMEEGRSAFKILTGKSTGKRPLGRPRCIREDSIRMDLKGMGISTRNWLDSAQDRAYWRAVVNETLNLLGSICYGVSYITYRNERVPLYLRTTYINTDTIGGAPLTCGQEVGGADTVRK